MKLSKEEIYDLTIKNISDLEALNSHAIKLTADVIPQTQKLLILSRGLIYDLIEENKQLKAEIERLKNVR